MTAQLNIHALLHGLFHLTFVKLNQATNLNRRIAVTVFVLSYVRTAQLFLHPRLVPHRGHSLIPCLSHRPSWITVSYQLSSIFIFFNGLL